MPPAAGPGSGAFFGILLPFGPIWAWFILTYGVRVCYSLHCNERLMHEGWNAWNAWTTVYTDTYRMTANFQFNLASMISVIGIGNH